MEPEPHAELLAITRALRAHLDIHQQAGTFALPRDTAPSTEAQPPPVPRGASAARAEPSRPESSRADATQVSAASAPARAGAVAVSAGPAVESAGAAGISVAPIADPSLEGRQRRLDVLREEVRACTRCSLAAGRTNTVFARGNGSSGLCFVGEGPGAEEDAQGYPFVGAAGQLLDKMIGAMGFSRDDVYVCNIVKCRPPQNRKPEPAEMAACMPYLTEQIELLDPQVIVALGGTAVQGLLGTTEGIMRLRGKWKLYRGRIAVMPTFHPAYLLRTPDAKRDVWSDLQAVLRQMGRALPPRSR